MSLIAAATAAACAVGSGDRPAETVPGTSGPSPTTSPTTSPPSPVETLLLTDFGSSTVTFLDLSGAPATSAGPGTPTDTVEVGTAPYGLAVGADGRAWVATAEGVAVVDTTARERVDLIEYETETGPVTTGEYRGGGMGIAIAPDGRHVYVGVNVPGDTGTLEVIDAARREVVGSVPVGRRPFDVDVARDGSEVYTTNHDSYDVTAVATATLAVRRMEVAPYGTAGGLGGWLKPHYAVVREDGALLLPFEGERLAVLDPTAGTVSVEPMTANTHQHGAALAPDGTLLVVGTGPIDPSSDLGPSLTMRSPGGTERVIALDGPHEDVAVSPDGQVAYVSGGFTRDGFWDGVTVVDLGTGTTRRVPAGTRPLGVAAL